MTHDQFVALRVISRFNRKIFDHRDHPWEQIGRCVYCGPCRIRLYQGTIPDCWPKIVRPLQPTAADEMLKRWNKL